MHQSLLELAHRLFTEALRGTPHFFTLHYYLPP